MLDAPRTVRVKFRKTGNLQYISHLDLQRTFNRVLVRAGLPLWYTKGFNPHIKMVFGLPLPVGCESETEFLDIRIERDMPLDEIKERLQTACGERGFTLTDAVCGTPPYLLDSEGEVIDILCKAANEVTGSDAKPYTLSGATYANRLPNAYPFGMSGNLPPDDFEKGRGGAHGVDESVSIARLKRAMKIYARALIYLDGARW